MLVLKVIDSLITHKSAFASAIAKDNLRNWYYMLLLGTIFLIFYFIKSLSSNPNLLFFFFDMLTPRFGLLLESQSQVPLRTHI